jgi:sugar O-acyltransferase (sialic acid O-acetyltransferase NeuD family)
VDREKNKNMRPLIIVGGGRLFPVMVGRVLVDKVHNVQFYLDGVFDDRSELSSTVRHISDAHRHRIHHYQSISSLPLKSQPYFVTAIGDPKLKAVYTEMIIEAGGKFVPLLNDDNEIAFSAQVGDAVLMRNCVIDAMARVSNYVWVDRNSVIGHGSKIEEYCHIGPNVTLCGNVTIGKMSTVHAGAIIGADVSIGSGCTVGLGSVVLRDVEDGATVLGNPARTVSIV